MKKLITGLFLALMLLTPLAPVSASIKVPERTSTKTWVEDFANVLSPQTEQYIQQYSQYLADDHSACIVVVTMDYVTGEIDDYCLSMFNQWRIGDSNFNNGVLLLLSIGDDDYYMMIGRGLEDDFPISDIQYLLDNYLEPDFAAKDYDSGVRKNGDWALTLKSAIVFGRIEIVPDTDKIVEIADKLSRKFTNDEEYIRKEIEVNLKRTLMFTLRPEHITGKWVREA